MRHVFSVTVGPVCFRVGSDWKEPVERLTQLYADYPEDVGVVPDFTVRLRSENLLRRFVRPSVVIDGDYMLPDAVPLALRHGLLAAEMAMNLQAALGMRKYLILHAASVERDGKVLILTGESGAGKSTLSAVLSEHGWRFMGDEFALIEPETGLAWPFPRPVSLKNQSIAVMQELAGGARLGPLLKDTPKGDIRHFTPSPAHLAAMHTPGKPAMVIFPRFGHQKSVRPMSISEVFVRLTAASTNYTFLGERGYGALTHLVQSCAARAIDYPDTASGIALVDELWSKTS